MKHVPGPIPLPKNQTIQAIATPNSHQMRTTIILAIQKQLEDNGIPTIYHPNSYLPNHPELIAPHSQNIWIDNDTLKIHTTWPSRPTSIPLADPQLLQKLINTLK